MARQRGKWRAVPLGWREGSTKRDLMMHLFFQLKFEVQLDSYLSIDLLHSSRLTTRLSAKGEQLLEGSGPLRSKGGKVTRKAAGEIAVASSISR